MFTPANGIDGPRLMAEQPTRPHTFEGFDQIFRQSVNQLTVTGAPLRQPFDVNKLILVVWLVFEVGQKFSRIHIDILP
jgi:hypothetical protein